MTLIHEDEQEILIKAFLDRGEIRDCFVIEFLLRRGVTLPSDIGKEVGWFLKKMDDFNDRDFKVKLGSILGAKLREHKKKHSALSKRINNRDSFDELAVI